jgi:hypothetical protein
LKSQASNLGVRDEEAGKPARAIGVDYVQHSRRQDGPQDGSQCRYCGKREGPDEEGEEEARGEGGVKMLLSDTTIKIY